MGMKCGRNLPLHFYTRRQRSEAQSLDKLLSPRFQGTSKYAMKKEVKDSAVSFCWLCDSGQVLTFLFLVSWQLNKDNKTCPECDQPQRAAVKNKQGDRFRRAQRIVRHYLNTKYGLQSEYFSGGISQRWLCDQKIRLQSLFSPLPCQSPEVDGAGTCRQQRKNRTQTRL